MVICKGKTLALSTLVFIKPLKPKKKKPLKPIKFLQEGNFFYAVLKHMDQEYLKENLPLQTERPTML